MFHVIYQTRETVFHQDIQTPRRELKYNAQRSIFKKIRGFWIPDETLSRVFDISSQSKQKLRVNREVKSSKSILIKTRYISKPPSRLGFFLF